MPLCPFHFLSAQIFDYTRWAYKVCSKSLFLIVFGPFDQKKNSNYDLFTSSAHTNMPKASFETNVVYLATIFLNYGSLRIGKTNLHLHKTTIINLNNLRCWRNTSWIKRGAHICLPPTRNVKSQIMSNLKRTSFNCVVVIEKIHRLCTHKICLRHWKYQKNPKGEFKSF